MGEIFGCRDTSYATLFAMLKAKQQHESMHLLLKDDNETIKDETKILQEITRFYGELFQSIGKNTKVLEACTEVHQYTIVRVMTEKQEESE